MNIIEALAARLPLPWKQSTCDGPPIWKVERQRPEDFTAEIYKRLKKYGMPEDEIRNLFYISNADYARLKKQVGAVPPADDEDDKPVIGRPKKTVEPLPAVKCKPAEIVATKDRNRVDLEPITAEDSDGLNYQDRHNLGIHTPTEAEKEDVFRPADGPACKLTLRDCAARLLAAIDAREKADKEIAHYTAEIRRLA